MLFEIFLQLFRTVSNLCQCRHQQQACLGSHEISGVICELSMFMKFKTPILATFSKPGTAFTSSSPDTAGTDLPVFGSAFSAMVPPVVTMATEGNFGLFTCILRSEDSVAPAEYVKKTITGVQWRMMEEISRSSY